MINSRGIVYVPFLILGLIAARPAAAQTVVRSVTVSPTTVSGGQWTSGTVTITAPAPATGMVIALESDSPLVWVPSFVSVFPGQTTANFTAITQETSLNTLVTIAASFGGDTVTAALSVTPTAGSVIDTVSVNAAQYDSRRGRLTIDARSTVRSATLSVYVTLTGELIGTLSNKRNGRYQGQFSWPVNPESITIKSSHGGNATAAVTSK